MKKLTTILTTLFSLLLILVTPAYAHVVVKPAEVGIASFQTFSMGVPNEKDNPTTEVRLTIPDGLKYVSPNVKPGWTINIKKDGSGEGAKVTEIDWTGGSIPAGQRDDFIFSAQVPAKEATLKWDAYQVYENGETVAWTHEPTKNDDDEASPPHSITKVINDLKATTENTYTESVSDNNLNFSLAAAALVLSVIAIALQLRNKKKE